ncbi:MAG: hypothetical protein ACYTG7_16160, partial [Planctomycetota bacterium]
MHAALNPWFKRTLVLLILYGFSLSGILWSQEPITRDRQQVILTKEEAARRGLRAQAEEAEFIQELEYDYGGLFSFTLSDFEDADGEHTL